MAFRAKLVELKTSTTDEMHDLEAVFILNHRRAPLTTPNDSAIQLHRDTRGGQIQLSDQFC